LSINTRPKALPESVGSPGLKSPSKIADPRYPGKRAKKGLLVQ
jgi:hypothetical protein